MNWINVLGLTERTRNSPLMFL